MYTRRTILMNFVATFEENTRKRFEKWLKSWAISGEVFLFLVFGNEAEAWLLCHREPKYFFPTCAIFGGKKNEGLFYSIQKENFQNVILSALYLNILEVEYATVGSPFPSQTFLFQIPVWPRLIWAVSVSREFLHVTEKNSKNQSVLILNLFPGGGGMEAAGSPVNWMGVESDGDVSRKIGKYKLKILNSHL